MTLASGFSLPVQLISKLPKTIQAAVFMLIACAVFASMSGLIRHISHSLPPLEIVFFRNLFGLLALSPWFFRNGFRALKTTRIGLYVARSIVGIISMTLWFTALTMVPLAEATALSFTAPMFSTILAVVILGEVVRIRRWSATMLGFAGAMIILRPTLDTIEPGTIMVLISAATMSTAGMFVKKLMETDTPTQSVAWMGILMVPLSFFPALFVWQWPSLETFMWLVLLGGIATIGHLAMSKALTLGEITAILPYDFTRLPFAALIGYVAFSEVPDFWTWIGAAVIFSSSVYITYREARMKRDKGVPVTATAGATQGAGGGAELDAVLVKKDRPRTP